MVPDLDTRRPVWIAFSDLFLDTDVRIWYPYTALIAAKSPYSIEELNGIFHNEVAPVVSGNLLSIAGEWAGFDNEWLVTSIQTYIAAGRAKPMRRLMNLLVEDDWKRISFLISTLRKLDQPEWEERKQIWNTLRSLFTDGFIPGSSPPLTRSQLGEIWHTEIWPGFALKEDFKRKEAIEAAYVTILEKAL